MSDTRHQHPTAPPPPRVAKQLERVELRQPLVKVVPDAPAATMSELLLHSLKALPGALRASVVAADNPADATGELSTTQIEQQAYLMLLAERVGSELGLARPTAIHIEGRQEHLVVVRRVDGKHVHLMGDERLDAGAVMATAGEDR